MQTDLTPLNRDRAPATAEEASEIVETMASAAADGPSGRFVDLAGSVAW